MINAIRARARVPHATRQEDSVALPARKKYIKASRRALGLIRNKADKTEKNVREEKTTVKGYYVT